MTLRLVSENGESTIPIGNLSDVAEAARAFAEQVEKGKIRAERVIVVAVIDGKVDFACFGQSPTICEGIGLLEMAKAKVMEGAWRE